MHPKRITHKKQRLVNARIFWGFACVFLFGFVTLNASSDELAPPPPVSIQVETSEAPSMPPEPPEAPPAPAANPAPFPEATGTPLPGEEILPEIIASTFQTRTVRLSESKKVYLLGMAEFKDVPKGGRILLLQRLPNIWLFVSRPTRKRNARLDHSKYSA